MDTALSAIEMTGTVDEQHQLRLDGVLPIPSSMRVRVIVLYPLAQEWDEKEWLQGAARNPAFQFLKDASEDIYTRMDGAPFSDQV